MFYPLIRSAFFALDPEVAHGWALSILRYTPAICFKTPKPHPVTAMGLRFEHPVGLAAGLDKNGLYLDALAKLGFSFIEVGTVTPKPQVGNPKPRIFRIPGQSAMINRLGFNNLGVDALVDRLKTTPYDGILGINIGKNKDTPLAQALDDYRYGLSRLYPYASYVTLNISSPNTADLRQLQLGDFFKHLISNLREDQLELAELHQRYVPLVVKVSPDETDDTLKIMADVMLSQGIDGIIATNTTCARDQVSQEPYGMESGGLSGPPLRQASTHALRLLKSVVGDEMALIGVGGIDSPSAAQEKLDAGASLLQVYTGLLYEGPGLIRRLVNNEDA